MMNMLPSRIFFDSLLDDYEDSRFKKSMKCDIFEKDGNYNVVMDIPGFKKEDINIECDNGVIKISCEKKEYMKNVKDHLTLEISKKMKLKQNLQMVL